MDEAARPDRRASDDRLTFLPDGSRPVSTTIGPYRLLQKIGEGGMGEVWLADQQEPVRRRVALKIVKRGMDTDQVVARFETERQALAMMDHPGIAKVFDAGCTPGGRPFFVLEYVQGIPITAHCDRHKVSLRKRLGLFVQVCEAVQHAHQKAVIHRDLKPSNVLVTIRGDEPIVKVIDFGVAKATSQRLTEHTVYTELGILIGTPEYMSPEQAEPTLQNVDTRTDVYSLGVLLYELLTGVLPFDMRELRALGYDEMRRRISEEDPPKPSTRLTRLGQGWTAAALKRCTEPRTLAREIRGDLDWITMKALEKDRTRRYGSAGELAADVARFLEHEPVLARAPSAAYRAQKFVRRHRLGVVLTALAFVSLVAFSVTTLLQARRIAREARTAEGVSEFLVDLFEVVDPGEARGETVTAREVLDGGVARIEVELRDQPEVRARLMRTMGDVYRNLGLYPRAEPLLAGAIATSRDITGAASRDAIAAGVSLAHLRRAQGRYDDGERLGRDTLALAQRALGHEDPLTLRAMHEVAENVEARGRFSEAETFLVKLLELRRRVLGREHPETLETMNALAATYRDLDRYDEAEMLLRETLAARRRILGANHPDTLESMSDLAATYSDLGRPEETERLDRETLEIRREVLGPEHPTTLGSMTNLGVTLMSAGRYDEAEQVQRRALEIERRVLGPEHPTTLASMYNLGVLLQTMERYEEAETVHREALEIEQRVLGPDHPDVGASYYNLACIESRLGRLDSALDELQRAVASHYANATWMLADDDLAALHGDLRFDAIVAAVKRNEENR